MAEYKETIKKLERMCNYYKHCEGCPLDGNCVYDIRNMVARAEEIENVVTEWAKEHPVKKNIDKLLEVFPMIDRGEILICNYCVGLKCSNNGCEKCENKEFWLKEYEEPTGE